MDPVTNYKGTQQPNVFFSTTAIQIHCTVTVNGYCIKLGGNQTQNNHAADTVVTMYNKQKYSTIMACDSFPLNETAPNKGKPLHPLAFSWPVATVKALRCPSFQNVLQFFFHKSYADKQAFWLALQIHQWERKMNHLELQQKKQHSREYQT